MINKADSPKDYFDQPQSPKIKAKRSLVSFMLSVAGYKKVGDLGIAGTLVYQSPRGKYLLIKNA